MLQNFMLKFLDTFYGSKTLKVHFLFLAFQECKKTSSLDCMTKVL